MKFNTIQQIAGTCLDSKESDQPLQ